jgi:hypothetical protein
MEGSFFFVAPGSAGPADYQRAPRRRGFIAMT